MEMGWDFADMLQQTALGRIDVKTTKVGWKNCNLPHAKREFEA